MAATPVSPSRRAFRHRPATIFCIEFFGGLLAFLGVGWIASRRAAMGFFLLLAWMLGFWTATWALVFLFTDTDTRLPAYIVAVAIYITIPFLSALAAATTYAKQMH